MNGTLVTLVAGRCEGCGHDRVWACLYILAGLGILLGRADKRGERNIRNGNDGAVTILECEN